jgi:dCTP deaminase
MTLLAGDGLKREIGKAIKIQPFRAGNLCGEVYDLTLDKEFLKMKSEEIPLIDPRNLEISGEGTLADEFILPSGHFVLARSEEWLELDKSTMAMVSGKSSLARLGLQVESAAILHPGHSGYVVLEITNLNNVSFKLVKGMRIAQLVFFRTSHPVEPYASRKNSTFKTQRGIQLPDKISFSE